MKPAPPKNVAGKPAAATPLPVKKPVAAPPPVKPAAPPAKPAAAKPAPAPAKPAAAAPPPVKPAAAPLPVKPVAAAPTPVKPVAAPLPAKPAPKPANTAPAQPAPTPANTAPAQPAPTPANPAPTPANPSATPAKPASTPANPSAAAPTAKPAPAPKTPFPASPIPGSPVLSPASMVPTSPSPAPSPAPTTTPTTTPSPATTNTVSTTPTTGSTNPTSSIDTDDKTVGGRVVKGMLMRTYIYAFILCVSLLLATDLKMDKKFDGYHRMVSMEELFSFGSSKKFGINCGVIGAKVGTYGDRKCTKDVVVKNGQRHGCYLTECGKERQTMCTEPGNGWISKKAYRDGCSSRYPVRHLCCRPLQNLCTWQGTWSAPTFPPKSVQCDFVPDKFCGRLWCRNEKKDHRIYADANGRCRLLFLNGKWANATCGLIQFGHKKWYKKVDLFSKIDA